MKKILIGLFVLTFLVLVLCVVEQTQSEPTPDSKTGAPPGDQRAEAPGYNKGDSWIFRVKRETQTWRSDDAIGKGGDFEVISSGRLNSIFRVQGEERVSIDRPGHLFWVLPTGRVQENPAKLFDFPLFVGKKWQVKFFDGRKWHTAVNEVTAIEPIDTPAGTFAAFKIDRIISHSLPDGDVTYQRVNYFYSPETRSVVKYSFVFETLVCGAYETAEIELIKHGLRKTPPKSAGEEKVASLPVGAPGPAPSQVATIMLDRDDKVQPPEKAGVKEQTVAAETKKSQEPIKAEGPTPAALATPKEASPAPVAKPQQALPSATPLALRMNIIGQRKEADGSYVEVLVNEGSILRSHDNFQVHLETNRPAYVYVLLYDSQGEASQIFPDPKIDQPGFIEAGKKVVIPGEDLWFWLDENTGAETVYVLASEKSMPDIRGLLAKMETADDAGQKRVSREIKERIAVIKRGVGGITKGQAATYALSDGKKIQKVTEVVTGTSSVVRAVSFLHAGSPLQTTARTKRGDGC